MLLRLTILLGTVICSGILTAQQEQAKPKESTSTEITALPAKYLDQVSAKADKYYKQVASKTEKTLEKLVKWEDKIKGLLEKVSPETVTRLFGNNQLTFKTLLQQYNEGKIITDGYVVQYNDYRDKLNNTLKYVEEKKTELNKKLITPLNNARQKVAEVEKQIKSTEAMDRIIKERKKQLMQQALQYIGKSKYLQKISKESYYYFEAVKNYKEIFADSKKAEELAIKLLKKIPGFNEFIEKNSLLASLFGSPGGGGNPNGTIGLLQSRLSVQMTAQTQLRAAGPNPQQIFQQAMQTARGQINELKQQIAKYGGGGSDFEVPDFKPNQQKAKTFFQKIELSANIQSSKHNNFFPVSSDIGFSAGYKPNNKMIVGIGGAYKIGWGSGLSNIQITHQGVGLRSFLDWKLKGNLFISSGYEQNYFVEIRSIEQLRDYSSWKSSALLGIAKKYNIGKKRKGEMKVLYDFFSQTKVPKTSAVLFRVGFGL